MVLTRSVRVLGATALTIALTFMSAPASSADQTRDDQWALNALQAEAAWKLSKGKGVTVAVIDDGVNAQHVDLRNNVLNGKDFLDGDAPSPSPGDSHGTEMASVIAGHGHGAGGADGVMGLAPDAEILPIRMNLEGDSGFSEEIRYAVDHGASVINISVGSSQDDPDDRKAVAYALKRNVLVVTASGNEGKANDIEFPGEYPGVLTVGAVDNSGTIWNKSNYGPEVMLTAPGTHIVAAGSPGNKLRDGTGTSDSAAFVSAAAALIRSKFPHLTAGQVANRLVKTAALPGVAKGIALPDEKYGYGIIQPLAALKRDIAPGPKYGPLNVPESLEGHSSDTAAEARKSAAQQNLADRKAMIAWTVAGLIGLAVIGLIVLVIVKVSKRNKNNNGPGPGGPGSYSHGQQPVPPQQNPYQQQSPTQSHGHWPPRQ